jgi:hypothetical protein
MATKPFYGNPATDAPVFGKFAVLLSGLTSTIPSGVPAGATLATMGFILNDPAADPVVSTQWDPMGALDDNAPTDDGAESIDVTNHSAAGLGIYAKTFKNQQEQFTFTGLERTLRTLGILHDASGLTDTAGTLSGKLRLRDPLRKFRIGLVRHNDTTLERKVSENYGQIDSVTRSLTDGKPTFAVTMTVYPDAEGDVWDYYLGPKA